MCRIIVHVYLLLVLAAAPSLSRAASQKKAWKKDEWDKLGGISRNRRLHTMQSKVQLVSVDFASLVDEVKSSLSKNNGVDWSPSAGSNIATRRGQEMEFDLPNVGSVSCSFSLSSVMTPSLAAKFPSLIDVHGKCSRGITASLILSEDDETSMSATFFLPNRKSIYVDSEKKGSYYALYDREEASHAAANHGDDHGHTHDHQGKSSHDEAHHNHGHEFRCGYGKNNTSLHHRDLHEHKHRSTIADRFVSTRKNTKLHIFRLALTANKEFSAYHGGTAANVQLALLALLERVNGIYVRELGVFFQLIDDNDKLICSTDSNKCDRLENSNAAIDQNTKFIADQDIRTSDYDIGHIVTTFSGLAYGPSLCNDAFKAGGTTGIQNPESDLFWVDYFAHEIGHQLGASHIFRDCESDSFYEKPVEPGSGSTIMGYAGVCPQSKNVQSYGSPYFNSINLEEMRRVVEKRTKWHNCGIVKDTDLERPSVDVFDEICTIPAGSKAFALAGKIGGGPLDADWAYSWDRVDVGHESYLDTTVGRFRSWKPFNSKTRIMPNMHFLRYGSENILSEIMPTKDKNMTFRFIARTQYDSSSLLRGYDIGEIGDFAYADANVTFSTSIRPLKLKRNSFFNAEVTPNREYKIEWDAGGTFSLSPEIKVEMALNTLNPAKDFDYEDDLKELHWVELGIYQNSGSANVNIIGLGLTQAQEVFLRIRSQDDECYFFDIAMEVMLGPDESEEDGVTGTHTSPTASPNPIDQVTTTQPTSRVYALSTTSPPTSKPSDEATSIQSLETYAEFATPSVHSDNEKNSMNTISRSEDNYLSLPFMKFEDGSISSIDLSKDSLSTPVFNQMNTRTELSADDSRDRLIQTFSENTSSGINPMPPIQSKDKQKMMLRAQSAGTRTQATICSSFVYTAAFCLLLFQHA